MSGPAAAARPSRTSVARADAALAGVTLIWGVTFPVVKGALGLASPLLFNALRMSLAAAVLWLLWRPGWGDRATVRAGAILGACLAGGYAFQTAGLATTTPSKSAFITALSVVLVPLLLAGLWRRRIPPAAWAGVALAVAGLYCLVADPGHAGGAGRGEWLTLACAACFALHIIFMGEFAPRHGFRQLACLQILVCAVLTWGALPLLETPRLDPRAALWAAVAVTAVLATALAFSVQAWAQQSTPATHTAVVFALEPVFAWLASTLGWHERLHAVQLGGAVLILAAVACVEAKS